MLRGNVSLLKDTKLTEEQQSYVHFIVKNSRCIPEYLKHLMLLNRASQREKVNLQKSRVSILVQKTREIAKEIIALHQAKFSEMLNANDSYLYVDLDLYERVLQNILVNAAQYSLKNSIIEIKLRTTSTHLEIEITDQGEGFSTEALVHGTEQFYRGDSSRHSADHYGLGLYSAKQIIDLHKGELVLENRKPKKGTKVSIQLPLITEQ